MDITQQGRICYSLTKHLQKSRMSLRGTDKLRRRLRGKLYVSRDRHLRAKEQRLSDREFRLLEIFRDLSDWDSRHTETYLTFEAQNVDIATLLGWSVSKVSRVRELLISKNLIKVNNVGLFVVSDFSGNADLTAEQIFLGESSGRVSNANLQRENVVVQKQIASVQQNRSYNSKNTLVSFNGDFSSLRPCDRYLELEKSGRFGAMTADDMEFIQPSNEGWELVRKQILSR